MDQLTMAATIWGRLEHHLVSVGLSESKTLEIERAHCIGIIAEALGCKPVKKKKATTPVEAVSEMWNDGIEQATAEKLPLIEFPKVKPKPTPRPSDHMMKRGPSANLEEAMTKRLDQIIDQSINRKVGYDGDDEVGYDR